MTQLMLIINYILRFSENLFICYAWQKLESVHVGVHVRVVANVESAALTSPKPLTGSVNNSSGLGIGGDNV